MKCCFCSIIHKATFSLLPESNIELGASKLADAKWVMDFPWYPTLKPFALPSFDYVCQRFIYDYFFAETSPIHAKITALRKIGNLYDTVFTFLV